MTTIIASKHIRPIRLACGMQATQTAESIRGLRRCDMSDYADEAQRDLDDLLSAIRATFGNEHADDISKRCSLILEGSNENT